MRDNHNLSEILVNEFGVFVQLRKRLFDDTPTCPLCDEMMEQLNKPPIKIQSANHYQNVTSSFDFFACPDRDYPGHRRQEAAFRAACAFWIKPFSELLTLSDEELFNCRKTS